MGGKSRKTGGISKRLVRAIAASQAERFGTAKKHAHAERKQIVELRDTLNARHQQVDGQYQQALEGACECGRLLIQLKELVDHGHWKKWLAENFQGSYETARDYMSLARNWDHPKLQEARERGITLGIYACLQVVKGKRELSPEESDETLSPEEDETLSPEEEVKSLRKSMVGVWIEYMKDDFTNLTSVEELKFVYKHFNAAWEKFWEHLQSLQKEEALHTEESNYAGS